MVLQRTQTLVRYSDLGEVELENTSTYEGIWNDTSSLPEQIESDEE